MKKIKTIYTRISKVIKWLPVIWRDQDWDHWFIYQILKVKLNQQSKYIRKNGYHDMSNYDADRMDLCVRLIEKVQMEEYLDEAMRRKSWTVESMEAAEKKHNKARRLLFKVLEQNIERWWD